MLVPFSVKVTGQPGSDLEAAARELAYAQTGSKDLVLLDRDNRLFEQPDVQLMEATMTFIEAPRLPS